MRNTSLAFALAPSLALVVVACGKDKGKGSSSSGEEVTAPPAEATAPAVPPTASTAEAPASRCVLQRRRLGGLLDSHQAGVDGNGVKANYSGAVTGDEMTGTMTVSCPAGTGSGTWNLKKR